MNAIPLSAEAAERRARHLRLCQELAELGMDLARAAAREAKADLTAPIEHRMPAMAAEPVCRAPDPATLFTRISRAVRQAILLEEHIAAGLPPRREAPAARPLTERVSPETRPTTERLRVEALERLDDAFGPTSQPEAISEILVAIRESLGIPEPAPNPGSRHPTPPAPARPSPKPWHRPRQKPG